MRELKFRAYNKDLDMFFYAPNDSYSIVFHEAIAVIQMWCSDGLVDEIPADRVGQYTGLEDCEGVDIYEGDILSGFNDKFLSTVSFSIEDGGFIISIINGGGAMASQDYIESNFKIIGNIHQHKHLLEQ